MAVAAFVGGVAATAAVGAVLFGRSSQPHVVDVPQISVVPAEQVVAPVVPPAGNPPVSPPARFGNNPRRATGVAPAVPPAAPPPAVRSAPIAPAPAVRPAPAAPAPPPAGPAPPWRQTRRRLPKCTSDRTGWMSTDPMASFRSAKAACRSVDRTANSRWGTTESTSADRMAPISTSPCRRWEVISDPVSARRRNPLCRYRRVNAGRRPVRRAARLPAPVACGSRSRAWCRRA